MSQQKSRAYHHGHLLLLRAATPAEPYFLKCIPVDYLIVPFRLKLAGSSRSPSKSVCDAAAWTIRLPAAASASVALAEERTNGARAIVDRTGGHLARVR
jgi:hypothetical protein